MNLPFCTPPPTPLKHDNVFPSILVCVHIYCKFKLIITGFLFAICAKANSSGTLEFLCSALRDNSLRNNMQQRK